MTRTQNPYNVLRDRGVSRGKVIEIPQNYSFDLTIDTWWSAVQRARLYSEFSGLDALFSYTMKSSTWIRSAIDKRLRPLKARTFAVIVDGKEDETLTQLFADSPLIRQLVYQKGLSTFTYARVVGVNSDKSTYIYPLRNLDVVNKRLKTETYDPEGHIPVESHVNLFWMQTEYDSEDTLGLLEPICRDYINMCNSQNDWQTASKFLAYPQMFMYYENGDESMQAAATKAASQVGLGKVIISGQTTDEISGKVIKDLELQNVYGSAAADMFRIFKENIERLSGSIMQLVIGSSLLGMSEKNTNSERLVRAHLKMFRDICEEDARNVQDWFNTGNVMSKLAYIFNEPKLATAAIRVKPSSHIDVGDIEVYVKMLKDLGLGATEEFIRKAGLHVEDVIIRDENEEPENGGTPREKPDDVSREKNASRSVTRMVVDGAKRFFKRDKPGDGTTLER